MALDMVKFRLVWWFKYFGRGSKDDVTMLLLDVEGRCVDIKFDRIINVCSWAPSPVIDLSFNVDGSVRGSPSMAGIGGVLREAGGKILCLFPLHVEVVNLITTEVLAIHIACSLISSLRQFDGRFLTILSDSSLAVSWINGDGFGRLGLVHLVYNIKQFFSSRIIASIKYMPRGFNSLADSLAKADVDL
ncbi:hypothetical protein LWI28_013636 [Acer negundo]|uniref:RNase H type-1 domain-containing protein n=1 Tax=Acer negundo TaxID=4023 RepID=A0AAD5J0E5_ACENE|nr:hypothetical protein LWI28_013636 [Acer negundo]